MQRPHIKDVLREKILILDGAMGSLIQQYNLTDADYRGEVGIILINLSRICQK